MSRRAPDRNHDIGVPCCPQKPAALFQKRRSGSHLLSSPAPSGGAMSCAGRSAVTLSIVSRSLTKQTQFEGSYGTARGEDAGDGSRSREVAVPLGLICAPKPT